MATPGTQRIRPPGLTQNQTIVWDVADSIHVPPVIIDDYYVTVLQRTATLLGNPVILNAGNQGLNLSTPPPPSTTVFLWGSVLNPTVPSPPSSQASSLELRNKAMAARNNVFEALDRISSFIARAKNAGFAPPDNPFVLIASMNNSDTLIISTTLADELVPSIQTYVMLYEAEAQGKLDLNKSTYSVTQLSHASMGLQGFGSAGNTALNLLSLLPDADAIALQKAQDLLAALDFSKRVPKILFTADYAPDGNFQGSIIGWHRMADASGVTLTRHSIFENRDDAFDLPNTLLKAHYDQLIEYVKTWVLTFYDQVDPRTISIFLETTQKPDQYYNYRIQAYQFHNVETNAIFNVDLVPSNLSLAQRAALQAQMSALEGNVAQDTISPYPFLAQQLLGDSRLDWILAGVNVRASINRADTRTNTRGFSYLGAQLSFIFQQMDAGKFFVPKDVNDCQKNVADAISQFGLSQVIGELLEETGILFYFEGKEPKGPANLFTSFGSVPADPTSSTLLSAVLTAVDPETATLDLAAFASNIPVLLRGGTPSPTDGSISIASSPRVQTQTSEIDVPDFTNDVVAGSGLQSVNQQGSTPASVIDLTTFDGLSIFIRTLRIFSDFGPDAGGSISNVINIARSPFAALANTAITGLTSAAPGVGNQGLGLPAGTGGTTVSPTTVKITPKQPVDENGDPIITIKKPGGTSKF